MIQYGCHWAAKGRNKKDTHAEQSLLNIRKVVGDEVLRLAAENREDADKFTLTSTPDDASSATPKPRNSNSATTTRGFVETKNRKKTLGKLIDFLRKERTARKDANKKRKATDVVDAEAS